MVLFHIGLGIIFPELKPSMFNFENLFTFYSFYRDEMRCLIVYRRIKGSILLKT
jgi:hypothetical protein